MNASAYLEQEKERHLEELKAFLRIPSVSTDPNHKNDVRACAEWLSTRLAQAGFESPRIIETPGHPVVYAENLQAGSDKPTLLFYGHYDVQPPDPLHLWTTPAFEPDIRDGKIYARGAVDDKGQVLLAINAFEAHLKNGGLPINVKIMIEGEEEVGSTHLEQFLRDHKELLQSDAVLVCDTAMYSDGMPSLCYGLRGLTYMEIRVDGPNRDLHSGSFGGAVPNPANVLCEIIAKLKDENGHITIPGFYDDVLPLSDEDRKQASRLPFNEEEYCKTLQLKGLAGEKEYSPLERLTARPTLDVNGLLSGFTGEGAKTVLPATAMAKVSMRLVPNQETGDIAQKFTSYIQTLAPDNVRVTVKDLHGGNPAITPLDAPSVHAAVRALRRAFNGTEPYFIREGGSIPIVLLFDTILQAPTVLMGFGLHSENTHSPDEHFHLHNYHLGALSCAYFVEELAVK